MAINLYIPRLEWNEVTGLTGDTTNVLPNSNVVDNIPSTTALRAGMIIQGVGIPAGTRIVSKTLTSVTMSQHATAVGSAVALTFFERYDFQYPPIKDTEEKLKAVQKKTAALSGVEQVQTDNIEAERELEFGFVTSADADTLQNIFFLPWAVFGYSFRFFVDKDDSGFQTYTLNKNEFQRPRQVKKHPTFLYRLAFSFRRVVS